MKERIKEILERGTEDEIFPGAILFVAHGGEIHFHEAVGFRSSEESERPIELDQRMALRQRLLDMLIGDWDRHLDQWRFCGMFPPDR